MIRRGGKGVSGAENVLSYQIAVSYQNQVSAPDFYHFCCSLILNFGNDFMGT